jgi:hypothetical protein
LYKMGGGLMQLVAYGAQDVYLTGNPQITFWKVTYRRYTNFAIESIEQTFNGQADFGRRVQCVISRNGDLAYRTYLQVTLPEINQLMGIASFAAGVGEVDGVITRAADEGLEASDAFASAFQGFQQQAGDVSLACVGVGAGDEVVHDCSPFSVRGSRLLQPRTANRELRTDCQPICAKTAEAILSACASRYSTSRPSTSRRMSDSVPE